MGVVAGVSEGAQGISVCAEWRPFQDQKST
jgi:hypothetical protein